jgi:hypothetical protein
MRSLLGFTALSSVLVIGLAACDSSADLPDESTNGSVDTATADNNIDPVKSEYAYFEISADLRKCAWPVCGGWFVNRLNQGLTQCHDGRYAPTCYTPVLDWSEIKLSDSNKEELLDACNKGAVSQGVFAIVSGRIDPLNSTTPSPTMGRFVINEAWVAVNEALSGGAFVRVRDNGIRCITAPCPSVTEETLNMPQIVNISAIDWKPGKFSEEQVGQCINWMATSDGLLVAGNRYTEPGTGNPALARTATAAYYKLIDEK